MRLAFSIVVLTCLVWPAWAKESSRKWTYPETRRTDDADEMHGERIEDPYRWLEADFDDEVAAWDRAQTKLFRAFVDAYPGREEISERVDKELSLPGMASMPRFEGGKRWFTKRPEGANHGVLYVTDLEGEAPPQVVLDPNTWSEDGTEGLNSWEPSPDGRYVAYRRDQKGSEATTLYVKDLETGETLPDVITRTKFSPMVWDTDSSGFFYTRLPDPESVPEKEAQYHRRVYYHKLGTRLIDDVEVYGSGRPMVESKWVWRSSDKQHFFISRGMPYREIDTFWLRRDGTRFELVPIVVGDGHRTYCDRVGDTFLFNTDRNTGLRQLYTAPVLSTGAPGTWTELTFPRNETAVLDEIVVVEDRVVALIRENVVSRLWVRPLDGGAPAGEIQLPGPGTVRRLTTRDGDSRLWFNFQSFSTPSTHYVCDLGKRPWKLEAIETLPTTLAVEDLVSEQLMYPSKDGTQIPIFLLRHKDTELGKAAPTVLYGYGGFRVGMYPGFSRARGIWAELGGVWAVACLRGGDEFGEAWHQAGCLANKQNVFDDFIAAADWLVETHRAARDHLAIYGGSNGGLLVAACINQRPDLCAAVVCSVPLTDMLRYHRFQYARSWTKEYGDPDVKAEFEWIRPYSPYHNVQPGAAYPSILVEAGLHDGRVNPFHARKIIAQWQRATSGAKPILMNLDRDSGHGSASLKQYRADLVDRFAFLRKALTVE